jgi:hypothetical protein
VTTINEPPATATFDIANKRCELRDRGGLGGRSTCSPPVAAADSLTAIAQLATTALNLAKHITEQSARQIPMPHTPKRARTHHMAESNYSPSFQPLPSPSDIPCFMRYAKEKLGITDAASYITPLQENRLGPDILSDADMATLTSSKIGILYGDALRLCNAAPSWWSSHSKRCHDSEDDNDPNINSFTAGDGQNTEEQGMLRLCAQYPDSGEVS